MPSLNAEIAPDIPPAHLLSCHTITTSWSQLRVCLSRIVQGVRRVCVVVVVMEGPLRIESPYLRSLIVCTVPYTLQHIYPKEDEEAHDPRQAASQEQR